MRQRLGIPSQILIICCCLAFILRTTSAAGESWCLQFETDMRFTANIKTGTVIQQASEYPTLLETAVPSKAAYGFSADGLHLAYFENQSRTSLKVIDLKMPVMLFDQERKNWNDRYSVSTNEILWSPDGNRIFYHWQDPVKQESFLAMADAAGKEMHLLSLGTATWAQFGEWSSDGQYLALFTASDENMVENVRLHFLDVATFQNAPLPVEGNILRGCHFNLDSLWCDMWAQHGHSIAQVFEPSLYVYYLLLWRVGDPNWSVFPLPSPPKAVLTYDAKISPDGKYAAVRYTVIEGESHDNERIDVFGTDNSAIEDIEQIGRQNLITVNRSYPEPLLAWAPNGQTLVYFQPGKGKDDNLTTEIHSFSLATSRVTTLMSFDYYKKIDDIQIAPDETRVAVNMPDDQTRSIIISSLDGSATKLFDDAESLYFPTVWSPDGRWLAYVANGGPDSTDYRVRVVSPTGEVLLSYIPPAKDRLYARGNYIRTLRWVICPHS